MRRQLPVLFCIAICASPLPGSAQSQGAGPAASGSAAQASPAAQPATANNNSKKIKSKEKPANNSGASQSAGAPSAPGTPEKEKPMVGNTQTSQAQQAQAPNSPPTATATSTDAKPEPPFSVAPASVFAGESYTLTIVASAKSCTDKTDLASDIQSVSASSTSDVTVGAPLAIKGQPCQLGVPASVSQDAVEGTVTLFLHGKSTATPETLETAQLTIQPARRKAPGPIPPGLSAETDLEWKVLPRKAVADRYGNRVANHFFAIEATIGNNTGYDLQVAALAFTLSNKDPNAPTTIEDQRNYRTSFTVPPSPTDAYPIVRGTIEREQSVGTRAIVVNLVGAAGPILTGIGAFYVGGTSQNYLLSANIFSGPFEKGLELVYPDLTTNHLINLDSNTLRDSTVISNNQQVRVNAFISRELVECGYPSHLYTFYHVPSSASCQTARRASSQTTTADDRLPFMYDYNPVKVKEKLGELVLYGRPIYYLSRVRVVAGAEPDLRTPIPAAAPPTVAPAAPQQPADASGDAQKKKEPPAAATPPSPSPAQQPPKSGHK